MPSRTVHDCACSLCQQDLVHPARAWHQRLNLLISRLDEQQRRWLAAHEAQRIGHGGDKLVSQITGLDEKTIARGRRELHGELADCPPGRIRRVGGGRPCAEKKTLR